MSNTITITGQLGKDPELRFTGGGKPVLGFSIADTPRKFDRDRNEWVDAGDTLWLDVSIFGDDAEVLADQLFKGCRATVVGKLKARSYEKDGQKRTVNEILADSVAAHARRPQQTSYQQRPQQRQAEDPWAS